MLSSLLLVLPKTFPLQVRHLTTKPLHPTICLHTAHPQVLPWSSFPLCDILPTRCCYLVFEHFTFTFMFRTLFRILYPLIVKMCPYQYIHLCVSRPVYSILISSEFVISYSLLLLPSELPKQLIFSALSLLSAVVYLQVSVPYINMGM
jgi:hypothetical protein